MTSTKPAKLPPTEGPRCGTDAGHTAHHRRGESACEPCQLAHRTRTRAANRRHRSGPEGREAVNAASRAIRDRRRARTPEQADTDFLAKWPTGKPCRSCGEVLPAEAFRRNWTETDGRDRRCDRNGCRARDYRLKQLARVADRRGLPKGRCAYCETGPVDHIDHFYPVSKGGPDHIDNMVQACAPCNLTKSDRDPWEYLAEHHPDRLDFFRALFKESA
ncbi:HNH endonuclease [Microbacterium aurugineum]|uniref:HNH endonuclease n=1 Tax=Microbacterium aurugineum TaxID=2851642 RepID=UPI0039BDC850